jgi:hypothetical protein
MFNVITPLARYNNLNKLTDMLEPHNIKWHIITDSDSTEKIEINKKWINHYICPNNEKEFFERCNYSINWFIENQKIIENEFYCFLNDDDAYENNFFEKIKLAIDNKENNEEHKNILLCSMQRGDNIPQDVIPIRRHPTTKLWALPNMIGIGMTGIEQIILKGKILKKYRIPLLNDGDGRFIMKILLENKFTLVPEADVLFNYYELGRWNNV